MNRWWLRTLVLAPSIALGLAGLIPATGLNVPFHSQLLARALPAPEADERVVDPENAPDVPEWQFNPDTGHHYGQVDGLRWVEAEAYAVHLGGHLATINDQAEQDWLSATFTTPNLAIGFNDLASEGTWVWSSGEPVTYTNWVPGEPNNFTGVDPAGENIAAMNWTDPEGVVGWNDVPGNGPALIEVRAVPTPTPTPVMTPTPKATPTPTSKPTPTPTSKPTPTPTSKPTATPTPKPTPTPTPTPTLTPTPSPTPGETPAPFPGATGGSGPGGDTAAASGSTGSPAPSPTGAVLGAAGQGAAGPSPASGSTTGGGASSGQASGLVIETTAVRPALVASVTDFERVTGRLDVIGTNVLLAVILLLLIGLTSALFNATLDENRTEIEGWFARISARTSTAAEPLLRPIHVRLSGLPHTGRAAAIGRVAAVLSLTALIYGFLSPDFALDGRSLIVFVALLVGLGIVTYLSEGGSVLVSTLRLHAPAGIRLYGAALAIAIGSVLISRVIDFKPGVLYGFVASAVLLAPVSLGRRQRAEMVLVPTLLLLAASLAAWLLLLPIRAAGQSEESWPLGLLEAVAAIVFVAGLEGAFFNMIPIDFMDGATVARWNPLVWGLVFGFSGFLLWHLLLNQDSSYLAAFAETKVIGAFMVVALFSAATVAIWTYFHLRRPRLARSNS